MEKREKISRQVIIIAFNPCQPTTLRQIKLFQPTKHRSIFSIIPPLTNLVLSESPKGRPKYFIVREDTLQPRIQAKPPTSSTAPVGTNSNFDNLVFNPKIASKHKKKDNAYDGDDMNLPHKTSKYHLQIVNETQGARHYSSTPPKILIRTPYSQWNTTFYSKPP
jgi:hypothetical protein